MITELKNLDPYNMTPMEALTAVVTKKEIIKEDPRDGEGSFIAIG